VLEQVARLERLAGELLTMTQSREARPAPVALAPFLAAIAADHGAAARAPEATVVLDAALLHRALDELLANAARHAPGTATVRAALAPGRPAPDRLMPDRLTIDIADRGPGVPEALRATLFEPFVSGRPDGTGLGLAIAREMVEAMDGTLSLAEPGPGAVFRLEVPCRAA
jgi:signal transduction histidine kinase